MIENITEFITIISLNIGIFGFLWKINKAISNNMDSIKDNRTAIEKLETSCKRQFKSCPQHKKEWIE